MVNNRKEEVEVKGVRLGLSTGVFVGLLLFLFLLLASYGMVRYYPNYISSIRGNQTLSEPAIEIFTWFPIFPIVIALIMLVIIISRLLWAGII